MAEKSKAVKKERKTYLTPPFVISYPNVFEARAVDADSKAKFGCQAIWNPAKFSDKDKQLWKAMTGALNAKSIEAFKRPWAKLPDNFKKGLRKGEEREGQEGYGPGMWFCSLTTSRRPGVVDLSRAPISSDEGNTEEIYPGAICRATVTVYSFNKKGKGVAFGLVNLQKVKDGPRLDNSTKAEEDFDEDIDSSWLDAEGDELSSEEPSSDEIPF